MSRVMRRRRTVVAAIVAAGAVALSACGSSEPARQNTEDFDASTFAKETFDGLEGQLTWYDVSGGLITEAKDETVWKNFTALTGIEAVGEYTDSSPTKFRAAAETGNVPWNLIEFGTGASFYQAAEAGLLAEIDTSLVPVDQVDPASVTEHGIRVEENGAVLVWNTEAIDGEQPTSSADLFDTERFPGKRCLFKYPEAAGTLEVALMADGVAPEDVYPLDVDRALAKLDTIKSDIVWWDSGSTAVQLLNNGECSMAMLWNGRIYDAIENQNLPLAFTWKGGVTTAAYYAVPKDAPNPETGFAGMAMWILDREGQIDFVNRTTYTTAIVGLDLEDFDPQIQPYVAAGENVADTITEDWKYIGENIDDLYSRLAAYQAD